VKLVFDTSVWVDHLRADALAGVIPALRGRFSLWFDSVASAELLGGCRSKAERRQVKKLLDPFRRARRVAHPLESDFLRAASAISRLRESGRTLKSPGAALLDGLIAAVCCRMGALVVTANVSDFELLALQMPLRVERFTTFRHRLLGQRLTP
jgi:predicted nucleic acid-binding protein